MTFESFCEKVVAIACGAGEAINVNFKHEDGKHIARFSNGVKVIGNTMAERVQVIWGSGHKAYATL